MEKQNDFYEMFGIGRRILVRILHYVLNETTVFTALDHIYQQMNGLPMGGYVSPTVARLVMDKMIEHLNSRVKEIAFIRAFIPL